MILARLPFRAFPNKYDIFKIAVPSFSEQIRYWCCGCCCFCDCGSDIRSAKYVFAYCYIVLNKVNIV